MHYIEDFHLQGCLTNLKQKKWWENELKQNNSEEDETKSSLDSSIYKNDYRMALFAHSVENAIFVMLPMIVDLLISEFTNHIHNSWILFSLSTILISLSHYIIDDDKANKMKINLIQDQLYHLAYIVFIFISYFPIIGAWIV